MAERTLILRELNRALLARQLLLDRASISALEAIRQVAGLQAQAQVPPYIGLWSRLRSFHGEDLAQLLEQRQVVRATMMRSTLHLMTADDYLLLRPLLQPALTRAMHSFFSAHAREIDIDQIVSSARTFIQEQPRTFVEIRSWLTELFPSVDPALLAYTVRTHLPLVQVPTNSKWSFSGSPAHVLAETWLGRPLVASPEGLRHLILRYLAAFGPATVKDIQVWSGLTQLQEAVEALKPDLRRFRDEQGKELLDLSNGPLPSESITVPPRFLPEFDNLILSHADRRRVVPDEYRKAIYLSAGRVRATFLVDGFVCGVWRSERKRDVAKLLIEPFIPLSDRLRSDLEQEGEALIRFIENDAAKFEIEFA
ncbi:MAG TPA: winged helix DNA-binding domain-containing protein [Ktedonobacteraceae bacterium]|nr:winged helix DNA-binding domain-containing protein [Ktedonobacteraceae bacterium]